MHRLKVILFFNFTLSLDIFSEAKEKLADVIINWGYQSLADYHSILKNADVAVSTANHEFFGVSMQVL